MSNGVVLEIGSKDLGEYDTPKTLSLIKKASAGDRKALEELKPALEAVPSLVALLGNVARYVENATLDRLAGENVLVRDAARRHVAAIRKNLAGEDPTPIENQLIEQIAAAWLWLQYCEFQVRTQQGEWGLFWDKRADHAQRRYLAAVKTLAQVRRLQVPAVLAQVNIATDGKQLNIMTPAPASLGEQESENGE